MPTWTVDEFSLLLAHPAPSPDELSDRLPGRSFGAVEVVRQGIHSFHRGINVSMLSKMMLRHLEERRGSLVCPAPGRCPGLC